MYSRIRSKLTYSWQYEEAEEKKGAGHPFLSHLPCLRPLVLKQQIQLKKFVKKYNKDHHKASMALLPHYFGHGQKNYQTSLPSSLSVPFALHIPLHFLLTFLFS
jgi:hypothetical protein